LNIQIHQQSARDIFSAAIVIDLLHSFLNQKLINLSKEKGGFLNQDLPVPSFS
jgi:hypothetical protein